MAEGKIDHIYVLAIDRLSRRLLDLVVLLDEFEAAGVAVSFVYQAELSYGPERKFIRHIFGAVAEFERDMTRARIADQRAYMKSQGRRLAGPVPYGMNRIRLTNSSFRTL